LAQAREPQAVTASPGLQSVGTLIVFDEALIRIFGDER
jgi:hypothetical protein